MNDNYDLVTFNNGHHGIIRLVFFKDQTFIAINNLGDTLQNSQYLEAQNLKTTVKRNFATHSDLSVEITDSKRHLKPWSGMRLTLLELLS